MANWLLGSATVLGLLAFFEPCTIATHTLFAVRAHQENSRGRLKALFSLWITRSLLTVALLLLFVALTPPPQWKAFLPAVILLFLAAVYIISRFTYVPIPHLEFYKLLPKRFVPSPGIQLGLTLPACTIPLFAVTVGLAVTVDSYPRAIYAGLLFTTLFILPTAIAIYKGVTSTGQVLLERSAKATPFITAFLFLGAAVLILAPEIDLSLGHIKYVLREPTFAGLAIGFIAGLVFSFNPVAFTSIPVMLAYVTKATEKRRAVLMGLAFVSGMILIHVVLGVAAAASGEWVKNIMGRFWGALLGPVLILLGLIWPGWIKFRLPWFGMKGREVTTLGGAFLLGIPFSIAVCPFCSPALVVMVATSAAVGSIPFGFFLLLSFALGRSIPILIGAWSVGWLESLNVLVNYQKQIEIVAGLILIASGLYLLNEYFFPV